MAVRLDCQAMLRESERGREESQRQQELMWFPGRWKPSDLRSGGGRLHGEGLRSQAEGMTGPHPFGPCVPRVHVSCSLPSVEHWHTQGALGRL